MGKIRTKIVRQRINITGRGELRDFSIKLPRDARRITGVLVLNDVVGFTDNGVFTPVVPVILSLAGTTTLKTTAWFFAIATTANYNKWDRIEKETTYVINDGILTSTIIRYQNHRTQAIITPVIADLVHESALEFHHEEFIENQSFTLTNTKQDYPYGLTIPSTYKFVKIIAEANASTTDAQKVRIARLGITADVSATVGIPLAESGSIDLSKTEFEQSSMIGLQALNHTIQLQFIN